MQLPYSKRLHLLAFPILSLGIAYAENPSDRTTAGGDLVPGNISASAGTQPLPASALTWADVDGDGLLDIFDLDLFDHVVEEAIVKTLRAHVNHLTTSISHGADHFRIMEHVGPG